VDGAFAVIVILIYLARQVGASNRLARAEAWGGPSSDISSANATFGVDPVFRKAMARLFAGGAERSDFDEDEAIVLDLYFVILANIYQQSYREVREGVLEEQAIEEFAARSLLGTRFFREGWLGYRRNLDAAFVECFEAKFDVG